MQVVETRWNSKYDCMASVLCLKTFCSTKDIFSSKVLTPHQRKLIESTSHTLKPLKETKLWSKETELRIYKMLDYCYNFFKKS